MSWEFSKLNENKLINGLGLTKCQSFSFLYGEEGDEESGADVDEFLRNISPDTRV